MGKSKKVVSDILEFIIAYSSFFGPIKSLDVTPDPDDNILIECALAAKAKFVITGDKKLLAMKTYLNIQIVSPEVFLEITDK